jgi:hypothetical protein
MRVSTEAEHEHTRPQPAFRRKRIEACVTGHGKSQASQHCFAWQRPLLHVPYYSRAALDPGSLGQIDVEGVQEGEQRLPVQHVQ